jgi:hypothetical protein
MAKLTLTDINSEQGFTADLNANFALIEAAIENTVSRDGTVPNSMSGNLDMNSQRILNLPAPQSSNDPVRYQDLLGSGLIDVTGVVLPSPSGQTGKVLTSDGTVNPVWQTLPNTNTLGIDDLVDPAADRILYFNNTSNVLEFLAVGTGLTLNSGTDTLSLSHLGIQSLVDPNGDRFLFWDDSAGAAAWLTAVAPIAFDTTNLKLDVLSLTDLGSGVAASTDWLLVWDTSAGVWKKVNPVQFSATPVGTSVMKGRTTDSTPLASDATTNIDTALSGFSLDGSSLYAVEGCILVDSGTAVDFLTQFVTTAAIVSSYMSYLVSPEGSTAGSGSSTSVEGMSYDGVTATGLAIRTTGTHAINIKGYVLTDVTAVTLDYYWAQESSSATTTTVKAGSWLRLTKIS